MIDEVVFLRHGRTAFNVARRLQGQIDVPLDIIGQWQADQSASELARRYYWAKVANIARHPDTLAQPGPGAAKSSDIEEYRQVPASSRRMVVVSSDLFRALQTAHAFADMLGLDVAADAGDITGIKDMNGRKACVVAGSDVTDAVRSQAPEASIEERDDYGQCLTSLLIGDVDAVAAGDAILTGLATVKGNGYVQVVGAPFGEERYGIAVKHGNTQLADSIGDILSDMIDDGTWRQAVRGMRRQIGYTVDSKLNPPDPAASSDTASSDTASADPEQGDE